MCDGSFEPQHDTLHYSVLLDDPHERTRPPRPLFVNLASMRTTGTGAQLAPSRGCKSIGKAAQGILTACEPLLGPLALVRSEKGGEVSTCHGNGGELRAD